MPRRRPLQEASRRITELRLAVGREADAQTVLGPGAAVGICEDIVTLVIGGADVDAVCEGGAGVCGGGGGHTGALILLVGKIERELGVTHFLTVALAGVGVVASKIVVGVDGVYVAILICDFGRVGRDVVVLRLNGHRYGRSRDGRAGRFCNGACRCDSARCSDIERGLRTVSYCSHAGRSDGLTCAGSGVTVIYVVG